MEITNAQELKLEIKKRMLERVRKDTVSAIKAQMNPTLYYKFEKLVDAALEFVSPTLIEVFDERCDELPQEKIDILVEKSIPNIFKLLKPVMDGMINLETYGLSRGIDEIYIVFGDDNEI